MQSYKVLPIGRLESDLTDRNIAPMQGSEGAPPAWLEVLPDYSDAVKDVTVGDRLLVFTWLHLASRETLQVHPRDDPSRPLTGVFSTRSPDRPNPIGLHPVTVLEIEGLRLLVSDMEAVDGTPVIDIKPVIRQRH
ncbi:MAG: tRNA (N6-threonylcarbamoyladenosine(37)-N6)-methyltransferase TrmO [Actinobacteria bacterium]|nr:MAG: tRNA (N6-threonylcarbamoyladenosine(37)-N6)-methyltransferase TrmO [Actinomycetota bacterium]